MWGLDLKPGYVALNETGLWDIYSWVQNLTSVTTFWLLRFDD